MKKAFFIFFAFVFSFLFTQTNYRFIYELNFKPNSKKDSLVTDHYALDVLPKEKVSSFYNYNFYKNDSILNSQMANSEIKGGVTIDFRNTPKAKYPLGVKMESDVMTFYETFNGDSYKIANEKMPVWKISKETKTIRNWKSQKATTEYDGRRWIAWFSSEFPISEGPYKFKGLPGLVTEIYDDANNFHFSLEAVMKVDKDFFPFIYKDAIPVNKEKLKKAYHNYLLDPGAKLRQGTIVDDGGTVFHVNGGFSKKFIDSETGKLQKKLKDFDNKIEKN